MGFVLLSPNVLLSAACQPDVVVLGAPFLCLYTLREPLCSKDLPFRWEPLKALYLLGPPTEAPDGFPPGTVG